jgi:cytochrome P450
MDTTLMSFFLAMVLYPEAQRKAQRELDTAMYLAGGNLNPGESHDHLSLPAFEDAENFPYVTALVQEVLRWNVIAPLGEMRCSECPVNVDVY